MRKIVFIALSALCLSSVAHANVSATVSTDGLNLQDPKGQQQLRLKVARVSKSLCQAQMQVPTWDPQGGKLLRRCAEATRIAAEPQVAAAIKSASTDRVAAIVLTFDRDRV